MQYKIEIWRTIDGFNGNYQISSFGNVRNKERLLTPCRNKQDKYLYISLQYQNKRRNLLLHRIVAKHFIPNPQNLSEVNHKDFNRSNNKVENLEWVTRRGNYLHALSKGKTKITRGEDCDYAILNTKQVRNIFTERKVYRTKYRDLAQKYGVKYSTIAHIMRGSRWNHIWREFNP